MSHESSNGKIYYTVAETAKFVRKALKTAFPELPARFFSVKSHSYSMGASINVRWEDGPTVKEVESVVKCYQGVSHIDITDLVHDKQDMVDDDGNPCHWGADYVNCSRSESYEEMKQYADYIVKHYCITTRRDAEFSFEVIRSGETGGYIQANGIFGDEDLSLFIYRTMREYGEFKHFLAAKERELARFTALPESVHKTDDATPAAKEDDAIETDEPEEAAVPQEETFIREDYCEDEEPDDSEVYMSINWQDGKLRLHSPWRVEKDEYKALRQNGFRNARGETTFFAAWTTEREAFLAETFDLETIYLDDEERILSNAQRRAELFEDFSENRAADYQRLDGEARDMAHGIPFGQPILVGHHSERRDRNYRNRIENKFRKGYENYNKAKYWERKATSSLKLAEYRTQNAGVVKRRIDRLEADYRKIMRRFESYRKEGTETSRTEKWLWFYTNRLAFEHALLAAMSPEKTELPELEVGGAIYFIGGWNRIIRVNKKSVTVEWFVGNGYIVKHSDIQPDKVMSKAEFDAAKKTPASTANSWKIERAE